MWYARDANDVARDFLRQHDYSRLQSFNTKWFCNKKTRLRLSVFEADYTCFIKVLKDIHNIKYNSLLLFSMRIEICIANYIRERKVLFYM